MFDLTAFSLAELVPFILIGFGAQLIDGALGMAFGVISATLLVGMGVSPASASASVHTVESFTTGASGISHILHRNVDWRLFGRIVVPGMIGGICGAYLLSQISAKAAQPFVLLYLSGIGLYLLWRAFRHRHQERQPKVIGPLGLAGGFLDAAGGGGWGAIVTSNLLIQGGNPRKVIGTVNTAEFFLTVTISITFLLTLSLSSFREEAIGLLIGGVLAAPLGGLVAKRIPARGLLIMVGVILLITSLYGIIQALR